jgi:ankyrin repeat protein
MKKIILLSLTFLVSSTHAAENNQQLGAPRRQREEPYNRRQLRRQLPKPPREQYKWTALHQAAFEGNVGNVHRLLTVPLNPAQRQWPANPNKQEPGQHRTPTFIATEQNSRHTLAALLEDPRTNPNIPNKNGYPPLFYAPTEEIAQLLVKGGAHVNYLAPNGRNPIQTFQEQGKFEIAAAIQQAHDALQIKIAQRQAAKTQIALHSATEASRSRAATAKAVIAVCPICQEPTDQGTIEPFTCNHSLHVACWQEAEKQAFAAHCLLCKTKERRSALDESAKRAEDAAHARKLKEQAEADERDYLLALALAAQDEPTYSDEES